MFEEGQGVEKDLIEAHKSYNIAAADPGLILDSAEKNRNAIERRMNMQQIREAQRRASEWKPLK